MTGLIDRLERKGFVRRVADPDRPPARPCGALPGGRWPSSRLCFADFGAQLDALYAEFTDEQLQTILRFMTEITRRQRDATARLAALGAGAKSEPIST